MLISTIFTMPGQLVGPVINMLPSLPKRHVFCSPKLPIELTDILPTDCNKPRSSDLGMSPMTSLFGAEYTQADYANCRKFAGCQPCPEHGRCDDYGKLTCNQGYLMIRNSCELNRVLHEKAFEAVMSVQRKLSENLGERLCRGDKTQFWVSDATFLSMMDERAGNFDKVEFLNSALEWVKYDSEL